MRFVWRTASPALLRDVGLVCLADGIVAVSFGATCVGGGLAWWVPVALSVLVFAGGAQIAAVGVVLAGGSPVAAVLAGPEGEAVELGPGDYLRYPGDIPHVFNALEPDTLGVIIMEHI